MATIIYKKFIKKSKNEQTLPGQAAPCVHQRVTSHASDVPLTQPNAERDKNIVHQITPRPIDRSFRSDGNTSCEGCQYEKKALTRYRWKIMIGLAMPFMIQSLDATIIAGALPYIASDFRNTSPIPARNYTFQSD